jgi:hypothetical protein
VHNIKCQSRKEAEAFKLALGESNALNNETKRVEQMLEQIADQRERQRVGKKRYTCNQ